MTEKRVQDDASFALGYDDIDDYWSRIAAKRVVGPQIDLILACDDDGGLPVLASQAIIARMRLQGLVEIFTTQLTPLGNTVRERLRQKEEDP